MHSSRYVRLAQYAVHQRLRGNRGFTLEAFADLGESICAPRTDVRQMCGELCVSRVEIEPDHVQGLAVPAAGHLDTGDVSQAMSVAGEASGLAACDGVMVGERRQRHASGGTKFDERLRRQ